MPKVSVIIPTYNRAHYICESIDSVFAQSFRDFEVIIVDDGSTDNTKEVLKKYGDRIRIIDQPNLGPPAAMNTGIKNSTGEYYVILGNDDALMPTMLERQLAVLENDPDLAFVCSGTYFMDAEGEIFKTSSDGRLREKNFRSLLFDNFVWHLTTILRRSVSDEMNHLDEGLLTTHDYDLWIRISTKYRFEYTDAPLAKFRRHPGNYSKSLDLHLQDHLTILKKKEIKELLSWIEQARFRAVYYYRFAMFYARMGHLLKASQCYWLAVLNYPLIGAVFWTHETEKMRFSLPYRVIKPYVMPFYYLVKFLLKSAGVKKSSVNSEDGSQAAELRRDTIV